jgi:nickel-dependent lactate racemase
MRKMIVHLSYGRDGLQLDLPENIRVLRSSYLPCVPDEVKAIQYALRNPLGSEALAQCVQPGMTVVIVHTDITRATPNDRLLPVILQEIEKSGVRPQDITLLNGLGTHRLQTEQEMRLMLGDEILDHYHCVQHDPYDDDNLVSLDKTSFGNPVRINRHYLQADVRILTGFIEPHFFAGFSGGPKSVLPALAGFESVWTNHSVANVAHPKATWGVTEGNPIWEEMKEVALMTSPTFILNVALNVNQQITAVFGGELVMAHTAGCSFVKKSTMVPVDQYFDIVITTNSGYPLDQNLYQSVKGMMAASTIVKEGGAIICATACEDGIPDHGGYADLLKEGGTPQGLLEMVERPGFQAPDQWQVQIQAMVQKRAEVFVYSDGLTESQIEETLFTPCKDILATLETLKRRYGEDASVAVLPEGPLTVPYFSKNNCHIM